MAERAVLSVPVVTSHTLTEYTIRSVTVQRDPWALVIHFMDNLGNAQSFSLAGDEAEVVVKAICIANLSTKSLPRRALEFLVAQGAIDAASIAGSPD